VARAAASANISSRDDERRQGRAEAAAARERLPGQTDQDRPGSTESGEQIAEAEESEAKHRVLSLDSRLAA
jgi:hypothetical protein